MKALFIAPDGEYKAEGNFKSAEEAWAYVDYVGPRWIFYPISFVTGDRCGRILDVPCGFDKSWIGKSVARLCHTLAENEEVTMGYLEGKWPFYLPA